MINFFLTSNHAVSQKLDDLSSRFNSLQNNVTKNSTDISELQKELNRHKQENTDNSKILSEELSKLKAHVISKSMGSSHPSTSKTAELVVPGIPDIVTSKLSPTEIAGAVFDFLRISNLKSDILTVRKLENKKNRNKGSDKSKIDKYSFITKLRSIEIRDYIISAKKQVKVINVKEIFPELVENTFRGQIYVNELLNSETYKLLLKTKAKAKILNYKYVWIRDYIIFIEKSEETDRIIINTDLDLENLD